jgi:hypothetical protein
MKPAPLDWTPVTSVSLSQYNSAFKFILRLGSGLYNQPMYHALLCAALNAPYSTNSAQKTYSHLPREVKFWADFSSINLTKPRQLNHYFCAHTFYWSSSQRCSMRYHIPDIHQGYTFFKFATRLQDKLLNYGTGYNETRQQVGSNCTSYIWRLKNTVITITDFLDIIHRRVFFFI